MIKRKALIIALLILASLTQAFNASATNIFESTYKGKASGFKIEMVRTLKQLENGNYIFSSNADNFFASLTEVSTFKIEDGIIIPLGYYHERKVFGKSSKETIDFDWKNKTARYERSDKPERNKTHPISLGLLDPALYQLAIQMDNFVNNQQYRYTFVKRNRIKDYEFERLGNESFELSKKEFEVITLRRKFTKNSETTVWLAPELDFQIAKLIHDDKDGTDFKVELISYSRDKNALTDFYNQIKNIDSQEKQEKTQNDALLN